MEESGAMLVCHGLERNGVTIGTCRPPFQAVPSEMVRHVHRRLLHGSHGLPPWWLSLSGRLRRRQAVPHGR